MLIIWINIQAVFQISALSVQCNNHLNKRKIIHILFFRKIKDIQR